MSIMDVSIVNVSIPAIAGDLGVSPNQATSLITGFGIAMAIAMPLTGWLVQRIGIVRLFFTCMAAFTGLSMLCSAAPNFESLVALRVLQGAVAGPIIPVCQALVMRTHPRNRIGIALSILSLTTFAAPAAGPLIGGWLTDNASWRWIFFVNLPLALVCAAVGARGLRADRVNRERRPVDMVGLVLLACWIGALQLALDLGKNLDWFDSNLIATLGIASAVFFGFFIAWVRGEREPIIDVTLFRIPSFSIGTLAASVGYALHLSNLILLPLWLLQYMGYSAVAAGIALAPIGIAGMAIVALAGRLIGTVDPRWLVSYSFFMFALALWMRAHYSTESDHFAIMLPSFVLGAGSALFFMPLLTIILSRVPEERLASATGMSTFLRYLAGAIGISVLTTAWSWRAAFHRARLVESASDGSSALADVLARLGSAGLGPRQQMAVIDGWIERQAYTLAINDLSLWCATIFAVMAIAVWFAGRPRGTSTAGAAAG